MDSVRDGKMSLIETFIRSMHLVTNDSPVYMLCNCDLVTWTKLILSNPCLYYLEKLLET